MGLIENLLTGGEKPPDLHLRKIDHQRVSVTAEAIRYGDRSIPTNEIQAMRVHVGEATQEVERNALFGRKIWTVSYIDAVVHITAIRGEPLALSNGIESQQELNAFNRWFRPLCSIVLPRVAHQLALRVIDGTDVQVKPVTLTKYGVKFTEGLIFRSQRTVEYSKVKVSDDDSKLVLTFTGTSHKPLQIRKEFSDNACVLAQVIEAIRSVQSGNTTRQQSKGAWSLNAFEARVVAEQVKSDELKINVLRVEARGYLSVNDTQPASFVVSLEDITGDFPKPVRSTHRTFQEADSSVFQVASEQTPIEPGAYLPKWTPIAAIFPDLLVCPVGGKRRIRGYVRLMQASRPGFGISLARPVRDSMGATGLIAQADFTFDHEHTENGYEDDERHLDLGIITAIRAGFLMSRIDGQIDTSELKTIREWVADHVASRPVATRADFRARCNHALSSAFEEVESGKLDSSALLDQIRSLRSAATKALALELALQVMSADDIAAKEELKLLDLIADSADYDPARYKRMKDVALFSVGSVQGGTNSLPSLLGFSPDADKGDIRRHLNTLYARWNARMASAATEDERARIQEMLNHISEAHKVYL